MNLRLRVERGWQRRGLFALSLLPLAALFCLTAALRRGAYRRGVLRSHRVAAPVIVVGNISVGGTGKTPLVVWLVEQGRRQGFRPGVISRGYGGRGGAAPRLVTADSDPEEVGDEPLLIARRTGVPVVVTADRPAAAEAVLAAGCDLVISDDGLQHYRLQRDVEIAVVDGRRGFGNGLCLPAGPLRERRGRLRRVDLVIRNGGDAALPGCAMALTGDTLVALDDPARRIGLRELGRGPVHAVAGIGHPQRFFDRLRAEGLELIEHPFPDHHHYRSEEIRFADDLPVLMTEKDAVKCLRFAQARHWFLPVEAQPDAAAVARMQTLLEGLRDG